MAEELKIYWIAEAAILMGRTEEWLRTKIKRGQGPPASRISPGRICIRHRDLMAWLDGLEQVGRPRLFAQPDTQFHIDVDEDEQNAE